jgi:hypothetical protein
MWKGDSGRMNYKYAMLLMAEINALFTLLQSPDARWNGVQEWLKAHPRLKYEVDYYVKISPDEALTNLRAYILEETGLPGVMVAAFITPEIEAKAKAAIVTLQTLYKERKAQDKQPVGEISDWVDNDRPIPIAHKSITDYQQQLKAKKKRKKKA